MSKLYPPIINTYMPAFTSIKDESGIERSKCKVYFSLSNFDNINSIGLVQVTITNQNNNISALNGQVAKNGILFYPVQVEQDSYNPKVDKYFIEIDSHIFTSLEKEAPEEWVPVLKNGNFNLNQYYKLQLRFCDKYSSAQKELDLYKNHEGTWLNVFKDNFSEWSSVCLIRRISNCRVVQTCFLRDNEGTYFSENDMFEFSGTLIFDDEIEKETLNSYRIKLFTDKTDNEELLVDSGICYSNNYNNINQIYYKSNCSLIADNDSVNPNTNERFRVEVEILTKDNYSFTEVFPFQLAERTCEEELDQNFIIVEDEENARIGIYYGSDDVKLNIKKGDIEYPIKITEPTDSTLEEEPTDSIDIIDDEIGTAYLIFRRASARTDFKEWETICVIKEKEMKDFFFDYSIESGVPYKYSVQRATNEKSSYRYSKIKKSEDIHICLYEYMYLVANNKQLKISLNHKVSSPKINISESKTDTIGSTYSFIKRNSAMRYRQYQISGTISFLDDEDNIFTNDKEIFNNHENIYQEFNNRNRITKYNDFVKEREYRKLVEDFLYEDNLKLVKTLTEGNILGKLMEISFNPNQTLSNYVYDFSATVYEDDENSLNNLHKYKVITTAIDLPELEPQQEGI